MQTLIPKILSCFVSFWNWPRSLNLIQINKNVAEFLNFAHLNPNLTFLVTKIGCGLAGFNPCQIAPMFYMVEYLDNVNLPDEFFEFLPNLEPTPDRIAKFDGY